MADWTTLAQQDDGAIISRELWQTLVDDVNWLYDNILLSERDEY